MFRQYSRYMRTNTDKADKEPPGPSARTIKLLISWEKKYGLDVIRKHLDDGLFSRDPAERVLCYRWLEQRRKARRNNVIAQVVAGASVALGLVAALLWPE